MISRRKFLTAASILTVPRASRAQAAKGASRIGLLRLGAFPPSFIEPFRQELRTLGYVEGQSVYFEYRVADRESQLPDFAAELVRLKVGVLLASGVQAVLPAHNATSTVPVVFVAAMDPVAMGVVTSLARPGGNVTGVSAIQPELMGKRLELLKELLPQLSRVSLLVPAGSPSVAQYVKDAEAAGKTLGIRIQVLAVRGAGDLEGAISAAQGGALVQLDDSALTTYRTEIAALALRKRVPTISGLNENVEAGELVGYGPRLADLYRLAALKVDKILKGSKPAELPVEQPTKIHLVINLKTAKAIGLTIPQPLLLRADEVIQ
jgi:putative ABC transport system substrate-binding protein